MLKDIITLYRNTLLIFLLLLWQVFVLLSVNTLRVCWSIVMTLLVQFLVPIWRSVGMSLNVQVLESMQAVSEVLMLKSVVAKYSIQASFHFLKSLNRPLSVAHRMVFVVVVRQCISLFGTKK